MKKHKQKKPLTNIEKIALTTLVFEMETENKRLTVILIAILVVNILEFLTSLITRW